MARKYILVDDLTGEEIPEGKSETVNYSLDGTAYSIDLTADNARKFRAVMAQYIAVSSEERPMVTRKPVVTKTEFDKVVPAEVLEEAQSLRGRHRIY